MCGCVQASAWLVLRSRATALGGAELNQTSSFHCFSSAFRFSCSLPIIPKAECVCMREKDWRCRARVTPARSPCRAHVACAPRLQQRHFFERVSTIRFFKIIMFYASPCRRAAERHLPGSVLHALRHSFAHIEDSWYWYQLIVMGGRRPAHCCKSCSVTYPDMAPSMHIYTHAPFQISFSFRPRLKPVAWRSISHSFVFWGVFARIPTFKGC